MGSKFITCFISLLFLAFLSISYGGSAAAQEELETETSERNYQDHQLVGLENACRVFDVECECINPERDIVLPSRAFGRQDVEQEPCMSPEEIDKLVKSQTNFRCMLAMEGAIGGSCEADWVCRIPCRLYTE